MATADQSNHEPQAPKKPRRVAAKSQEQWVMTPDVVKKIRKGIRTLN